MIGACENCDPLRRALERVEAENKALRKIGDAVSAMGPVFGGRHLGDEPLLAMVPIEKFGPVMDAWAEWKALSPPPQPEPVGCEGCRAGWPYTLIGWMHENPNHAFSPIPCTNPRRGSEGG